MTETDAAAPRLSRSGLRHALLHDGVRGPAGEPTSIGIVHIGLGAFARAHQAVYTEEAAAVTGQTHWGILGVTGRTDAVVRQLQPQDGLYGVLTREAHASSLRLVGIVRDVAWPGDRSGDVVETIAADTTHIATLTVTERGYPDAADQADLAADRALIRAELAGTPGQGASRTPVGLLVRGLARRYRRSAAGFTAISCDNLTGNGAVLRVGAQRIAGGLDDGFTAWLDRAVRFPSTMVDRITPATTDADRDDAAALTGFRDEALVVAEPFSQWVIEDDFGGPRPAWEQAGAILTHDVVPYEELKLRVLNATHLLFAWAGILRGHRTIAEAAADTELLQLARRTLDEDVLPSLVAPEGIDLHAYRDQVLARFADPALAHTTAQVGSDGSLKVPVRLVGTILDALAAGRVPTGLAAVIGAWAAVIAAGDALPAPADPMRDALRAAVGSEHDLLTDPLGSIRRLLAIERIFPPAIGVSDAFAQAAASAVPTVAPHHATMPDRPASSSHAEKEGPA